MGLVRFEVLAAIVSGSAGEEGKDFDPGTQEGNSALCHFLNQFVPEISHEVEGRLSRPDGGRGSFPGGGSLVGSLVVERRVCSVRR